jgi:dethiobiotin synthetase/adenosylmethionine--8-amino-7-oxononanoate aminotransferase
LTTALLRSTAALYENEERTSSNGAKKKVFYLKPVSTGSADEADDRYASARSFVEADADLDSRSYVKRNIGAGKHSWAEKISTKCLYQYREPVSPHLAAKLAPELVGVDMRNSFQS